MPIKPENKKRYPINWKTEIRPAILRRAQYLCECCGIHNHAVGYRDREGVFRPLQGNEAYDAAGLGKTWPDLQPISYAAALELVNSLNCCNNRIDDGNKWIVIVLTIAHLDEEIENCADSNLKALCQRCHNILDLPMRQRNARMTRRSRLACGDL